MNTLLSKYCEDFAKGIRPILEPLREAAKAIQGAPDSVPAASIRPEILDLVGQVEMLSQKVGEQQAYVLIFGPLKSGKSTLMNAICATYVSEVTSLPAYPCMVYVSHAPEMHYVLTQYDGEKHEFRDDAKLHAAIGHAHAMLADRIREVESSGETFDPQVHMPTAIRRIDVKVPAGDLEESGAVLVDTPGLYSRMKFGYDRMTREFRNAAACAVFVVKSDNLFLEQAFDEFHQLLELFSKVFLIVNLDLNKRDLLPDGTLAPSLESENPQSILEAFETLAMSSPLRKAAEDGRLQIFPVGLLDAASQRLRMQQGHRLPPDATEPGFDAFFSSLTDYLNSPDYMVSFLGDSLRHANTLLDECRALLSRDAVRELERSVNALELEATAVKSKLTANEELRAYDWRAKYQAVAQELSDEFKQRVRAVESKAAAATDGALEAWFQDASSLRDLNEKRFAPVFRAYQEELAMTLEESLRDRIRAGDAGLDDASETEERRKLVGLDLDAIGKRAIDSLDRSRVVLDPEDVVTGERVPIRRGLLDWLLFRSAAKLQTKVFGNDRSANQKLTPDLKRKRLGTKAHAAMRTALADYRKKFLTETFQRQRMEILAAYARKNLEGIARGLAVQHEELDVAHRRVDTNLRARRSVFDPLRVLQAQAANARTVIEHLSQEYGRRTPQDLLGPILEPMPRMKSPSAETVQGPSDTKEPVEAKSPDKAAGDNEARS
ncbi:MAG: GTPase domain-containing protein [Planctomycetes bacterium]|nr:GTPase domain-containing protein [Planctomycetota bacterium]